jgi:hypothetical protein
MQAYKDFPSLLKSLRLMVVVHIHLKSYIAWNPQGLTGYLQYNTAYKSQQSFYQSRQITESFQ